MGRVNPSRLRALGQLRAGVGEKGGMGVVGNSKQESYFTWRLAGALRRNGF